MAAFCRAGRSSPSSASAVCGASRTQQRLLSRARLLLSPQAFNTSQLSLLLVKLLTRTLLSSQTAGSSLRETLGDGTRSIASLKPISARCRARAHCPAAAAAAAGREDGHARRHGGGEAMTTPAAAAATAAGRSRARSRPRAATATAPRHHHHHPPYMTPSRPSSGAAPSQAAAASCWEPWREPPSLWAATFSA